LKRFSRTRLLILLAVIGPGIITSAADNDAGGITTYAVAGALFKYDLLWVLVLITFALAMIQEMCARMGAVTQKGLGELIRENYGVKWTMFALGVLFVANLATTVAEFAGIAASCQLLGIPKYISVPVAAIGIWLLVVKGTFKTVERVFILLTLFYSTYIVSGVLARPDWGEVFNATVSPNFHADSYFFFIIIAVVGTTITPWMQFFLQATVVEKGVHIDNYRYQKLDVFVGAFLTDLVAFFIVVAAGATVYGTLGGERVKDAAEVAQALRPIAGHYAEILFAIGLFSASLLAAAVLPLSTAYTYSEAFGWEIGISRKLREAPVFYGIYTFSILFGVVVVLMPMNMIDTMIRAQAINGILLPVILVFMLSLINRSDVMGTYVNGRFYNVVVWGLVAILTLMTLATLVGTLMGY